MRGCIVGTRNLGFREREPGPGEALLGDRQQFLGPTQPCHGGVDAFRRLPNAVVRWLGTRRGFHDGSVAESEPAAAQKRAAQPT